MANMKRILVLFFHPRFEDSTANRKLIEGISSMTDLTLKDVYELYPDFNIDIKKEQNDLLKNDIIFWMHPLHWYSCPPLMKQWIDLVLEVGWAFGKNGTNLRNKYITNVITFGGNTDSYQKEGKNRFTLREFLSPFNQTAHLCNMQYLPPFIVPSASNLNDSELSLFANKLIEAIQLLQSSEFDKLNLSEINYLNELR